MNRRTDGADTGQQVVDEHLSLALSLSLPLSSRMRLCLVGAYANARRRFHLKESVYRVGVHKSIYSQIRQLILYISNKKG